MQRVGFCVCYLSRLGCFAFLCLGSCSSKPELPIRVIYEIESASQAVIVHVENQSSRGMWVSVEFTNARHGLSHRSKLFIPGRGREALGWHDGWNFERGECVQLTNEGFRQKRVCLD